MNSKVVSEQIYIHDKILIADDRIAIIGSANLNDRSMLGDRDSEVTPLLACPPSLLLWIPHALGRWLSGLKMQSESRSLWEGRCGRQGSSFIKCA
jgi:phospholipase D1/2